MKMKRAVLIGGWIVAVWAGTARAQLLQPIDLSKEADVDHLKAVLPSLDMNTRAEPSHTLAISPLSGKQPDLKAYETRQIDLNTTELSILTLRSMPQQNFTGQRSPVTDQMLVEPFVSTSKASVPDRQIKAYTPAGTEELKNQLNGTPK